MSEWLDEYEREQGVKDEARSVRQDLCMHALERLVGPVPSNTSKPWRYKCRKCGGLYKIATGIIVE